MSRPRRSNPLGLPPCVYLKHGRFWLVKRGQWHDLGKDRTEALAGYAKATTAPKSGGMPILIERIYRVHIRSKSAQTATAYASAKKRLIEVFREFDPAQVLPKHVAALRMADSATPTAANRNQTFLRIVMDYALDEGLIESNPCIGAKRFKESTRDRYISDDEFRRIHGHAGARLQVIMELAYLTGQRIGDVLALRFEDLREDGVYFRQAKTGAKLTVAYSPGLSATLDRARALLTDGKVALIPSGHLLRGEKAHKRYKAPAYATILGQWHAACTAAGVENANLHDLRAKAATDGKRQGHDATALLGHASEKQTQTYLRAREVPVVSGPSFRQVLDK